MRREGRIDLRYLPPTARQQALLIAQAEERIERQCRNRLTGRTCPECSARFLGRPTQTFCGHACSARWNGRQREEARGAGSG